MIMQAPKPAAPKHTGLATSTDPSLRKLAEYETVYGGAVADHMMIFTELSPTVSDAVAEAAGLAGVLKEYARFSIQPVVIFEPTIRDQPVDAGAYRAGRYDAVLDAYFQALRASGVTDQTMGLWVPFPEGNTPRWRDTDPADFRANVAKTIGFQKKYFPGSQASILLDSKTYPSDDSDWAHGVSQSLVPYVQGLPKGLVDSIGLQGFPWTPPRGDSAPPSIDPAVFLRAELAEDIARKLGVSHLWFNTGTFARYYTDDPGMTVAYSAAQRAKVLDGIVAVARQAQAQGFSVAVNLFSADKSRQDEAVDWSYWHNLSADSGSSQTIFRAFAKSIYQSGIDLWLFDSESVYG